MKPINNFRPFLVLSIVIIMVLPSVRAVAQGDLLLFPRRVVFDGKQKSQDLTVANTGKDTATYNISFMEIRMRDNGSVEEITVPDSGQNFASRYIRVFPRKITLAPNEGQVVKVQLVKANELAPGEYRSHLYFRSVPVEMPLGDTTVAKKDTNISIQIIPIFGISTPVIIRVGETNTAIAISNFSINKESHQKPTLHFTFNRTGNMSVYGDLKIDYIAPDGATTEVKLMKGVSVYTPNLVRNFSIGLDEDKNINYSAGKLRISYTTPKNKNVVKIAESEFVLN